MVFFDGCNECCHGSILLSVTPNLAVFAIIASFMAAVYSFLSLWIHTGTRSGFMVERAVDMADGFLVLLAIATTEYTATIKGFRKTPNSVDNLTSHTITEFDHCIKIISLCVKTIILQCW